jgi:hypothetical protein
MEMHDADDVTRCLEKRRSLMDNPSKIARNGDRVKMTDRIALPVRSFFTARRAGLSGDADQGGTLVRHRNSIY